MPLLPCCNAAAAPLLKLARAAAPQYGKPLGYATCPSDVLSASPDSVCFNTGTDLEVPHLGVWEGLGVCVGKGWRATASGGAARSQRSRAQLSVLSARHVPHPCPIPAARPAAGLLRRVRRHPACTLLGAARLPAIRRPAAAADAATLCCGQQPPNTSPQGSTPPPLALPPPQVAYSNAFKNGDLHRWVQAQVRGGLTQSGSLGGCRMTRV